MTDQQPNIIVTTSDRYHHLLPIFFYLYIKYWNDPFILLGFKIPECKLPENCTFISMGEDKGPQNWSTGIREFVEQYPNDWMVWLMEDTFLKAPVDDLMAWGLTSIPTAGKINLTNDVSKREHTVTHGGVLYASPTSRYRLSMQPSIWNKRYFLQYIQYGMDPWTTETQDPKNDGWDILGLDPCPVISNEGVTRHDIYKLNLEGMKQEDIDHIKTLAPWLK